jgi:hypothetical protein
VQDYAAHRRLRRRPPGRYPLPRGTDRRRLRPLRRRPPHRGPPFLAISTHPANRGPEPRRRRSWPARFASFPPPGRCQSLPARPRLGLHPPQPLPDLIPQQQRRRDD